MQIYPVAQAARYLKGLLDCDSFLGDLWINGEVSNLSRSMAGHLYFTLKDEASQLRCVFFGGAHMSWLCNGTAVVTHGRVSFYEVSGAVQLYVDVVQPEGTGALHLKLEELRARLEREGLFEESRKRPLPAFPKRIGVVTSPTGAALRDILKILSRRYPLGEVLLAPTQVQGDGAAEGVADGLRQLNALGDIDVIIVARGGGSMEELWAFNEEPVVRAIHASHAPVVTGVGHETDTTLADLAADYRAPTPSGAAMAVAPDVIDLGRHVASMRQDLVLRTMSLLSQRSLSLEHTANDLFRSLPDIPAKRQRLDDLSGALLPSLRSLLQLKTERLRSIGLQLESLSPIQTLRRGYAIVRRGRDGQVVRRVAEVGPGEPIQVRVSDGVFEGSAGTKAARRRPAGATPGGDGLQGVLPLG